MKDKKLIYGICILVFFVVSCNEKNKSRVVSTISVQTETENNTYIKQQSQSDILEVSEKMQKQKKLTETDYTCICNFLFENTDESKSEEIGYQLFEYLKGNSLNNSNFMLYLNAKEAKEDILKLLIQIMCIDIGEENYTYDTFIKDFEMFSKSISAKNAFDECMNNQ